MPLIASSYRVAKSGELRDTRKRDVLPFSRVRFSYLLHFFRIALGSFITPFLARQFGWPFVVGQPNHRGRRGGQASGLLGLRGGDGCLAVRIDTHSYVLEIDVRCAQTLMP